MHITIWRCDVQVQRVISRARLTWSNRLWSLSITATGFDLVRQCHHHIYFLSNWLAAKDVNGKIQFFPFFGLSSTAGFKFSLFFVCYPIWLQRLAFWRGVNGWAGKWNSNWNAETRASASTAPPAPTRPTTSTINIPVRTPWPRPRRWCPSTSFSWLRATIRWLPTANLTFDF